MRTMIDLSRRTKPGLEFWFSRAVWLIGSSVLLWDIWVTFFTPHARH